MLSGIPAFSTEDWLSKVSDETNTSPSTGFWAARFVPGLYSSWRIALNSVVVSLGAAALTRLGAFASELHTARRRQRRSWWMTGWRSMHESNTA